MREHVASRVYQMKDWAIAMREHDAQPSVTRKFRHPTLGLCIEVIYIPMHEPEVSVPVFETLQQVVDAYRISRRE